MADGTRGMASCGSYVNGLASWCRPSQRSFSALSRPLGSWVLRSDNYYGPRSSLFSRDLAHKRVMVSRAVPPAQESAAPLENNNATERIIETELRHEAEQSYLSYAMSVIVGRALPDARDGLKPVHRRILYAMHELGLDPKKPFRKCARVVGEVLGKFHPHGDTAVYDALVRMAQDFSMRAPLVNGHGNFGSLDDDPAAAMRYTECRLQPLAAAALLEDLDSETVHFLPNFDASVMEPSVLPAKIPNLLVNGSSGIAVGIATKIPPHNMGEVVKGLQALIKNPDISVVELMKYIPAPDFPTGGLIISSDGLRDAYTTGRGTILVRAKMHMEETSKKKPLIVITELPYQTNKAALVEQVAKLVDEGKITGVSDIRDESDRSGMRIVIELKRGAIPDLTLNQLRKHTSVQSRFACNMIGLVNGLPTTLTLKDFLQTFLDFRCEVVEKRAQYDLEKSRRRLHLVDGFLVAMTNMDKVVGTIRGADDGGAAMQQLQSVFGLTKEQAEGILSLTLRRLTSMENKKLEEEHTALRTKIADLEDLILRKERVLEMVSKEAEKIAEQHGDIRRTEILHDEGEIEVKDVDVIPNSASIVSYSRKGYIKRMSADTFAVQGLRGTGKTGARLKDEDSLEDIIFVNDHDRLLFFTNEGRAYALNAYEIPESSRTSTGTAISQLLRNVKPSSIAAVLPVPAASEDIDVILLTSGGQIKKVALTQFGKINSNGVAAMKVREEDSLQFVSLCSSTDSVLLTSSLGLCLHFPGNVLRRVARTAMGVKAMNTGDGSIVGMSILPKGIAPEEEEEDSEQEEQDDDTVSEEGPWLFTLTKKGLGKRVPISTLRLVKGRIGKGSKVVKLNKGDAVASAIVVGTSKTGSQKEDILISTMNGMVVRVPLKQCRVVSRSGKGSFIVKVREGDEVSAATCIHNI